MDKNSKINKLNSILLEEMPEYKAQAELFSDKRRLLRSLMNLRPPSRLSDEFTVLQNELLQAELREKGIVDIDDLTPCKSDKRLFIWQGDITTLNSDAIVNAANSALLGCFCPCHSCIDNAIHSAAGLQLRDECNKIMQKQNGPEQTGKAKITSAYNLPSRYVIHTVGPIISGTLMKKQQEQLADCYKNCLLLADKKELKSIAFCCISTGEFHFPNDKAAQIAVNTVKQTLPSLKHIKKIIFNVFKDEDLKIYNDILN